MANRVEALLEQANPKRKWMRGNVPSHYKRITVDGFRQTRLAMQGYSAMNAAYGIECYYTQSLIAGCIISGEFDTIVIVTCSQYGKSWLLGHVALYQAYKQHPVYIAANTAQMTEIIMKQTLGSIPSASQEIRDSLENIDKSKIDKLARTLNKQRITTDTGGFVEEMTLGDGYTDLGKNQAVGRSGDFYIDEAALVSEDTMVEVGRRDFSRTDGGKYQLVMISNPHQVGPFYDALTAKDVDERTVIIWMDALTAVEEERWTKEQVLSSSFMKNQSAMTRYLLCELEASSMSMFNKPEVGDKPFGERSYFLGIDAAYRGKDNVEMCLLSQGDDGLYVEEVVTLDTSHWIDGVTSSDIVKQILQVYRSYGVSQVDVDIGYGVWCVEGLARSGANAYGISFASAPTKARVKANHYAATNAQNLRAEMHLDLQNLIEEKQIKFSPQAYDAVKDEMSLIACERKGNGRIQIRPKAAVKAVLGKSPDELDAVLLAIHACMTCRQLEYIT